MIKKRKRIWVNLSAVASDALTISSDLSAVSGATVPSFILCCHPRRLSTVESLPVSLFLGSSPAPLPGTLRCSGRNQSKNLQSDRWALRVESRTPEEEQGDPSWDWLPRGCDIISLPLAHPSCPSSLQVKEGPGKWHQVSFSFFLSFFVFLPFRGPLLWHMAVPRLGVQSEL